MLVASRGGHLHQLRVLAAESVPPLDDVVWVTDAHSAELQELIEIGHRAEGAHSPTRRHLGNMLKNLGRAFELLRQYEPDLVISTGAGVAPPFLLAARLREIAAVYIESATFINGPSLSGRLVSAIPGVHRYFQGDARAYGHRWLQLPSPFDDFSVVRTDEVARVGRVFVSLGTQEYPFDRLVQSMLRLADEAGIEVEWQLGASWVRKPALPGRVHRQMSASEWDAAARRADIVVGHAGTGLVLAALRAGKMPVIAARDPNLGEHVDDHQAHTVQQVRERGLGLVVTPETLTMEPLASAASTRVQHRADGRPMIDLRALVRAPRR